MNDRLEKGIQKINELVEGGEKGVLKGLGEAAPELANYVLEFIFGDLYGRDGLDMKTKQIITITSLAVLGFAKPQLAYHIKGALNLGLTRKEVMDVFIHVAGYAGFPAALTAVNTAKEVFAELDEKGS